MLALNFGHTMENPRGGKNTASVHGIGHGIKNSRLANECVQSGSGDIELLQCG
jgi:hypothetical protein